MGSATLSSLCLCLQYLYKHTSMYDLLITLGKEYKAAMAIPATAVDYAYCRRSYEDDCYTEGESNAQPIIPGEVVELCGCVCVWLCVPNKKLHTFLYTTIIIRVLL